ncbi:MAG: 6-phosphogluconolactonase [Phycisphaerales bacterium]
MANGPEDTYRLLDDMPPVPRLPGHVVLSEDADAALDAVGLDLVSHAKACVRAFGDFHLALSGGSTPMPLYERLMIDPAYRDLPWRRTHLWIVDERCVPFEHEKSNFGQIREVLCDHSDIPPSQVHPIHAYDDDADTRYEAELREVLGWREQGHDRLDFVLLGMGDDGHTASLFPHSDALHAHDRLACFNRGPAVTPPDRVTMTYPLINSARFIGALVLGAKKAHMLHRIATGAEPTSEIPIKGITPIGGEFRWYLDAAAARWPQ